MRIYALIGCVLLSVGRAAQRGCDSSLGWCQVKNLQEKSGESGPCKGKTSSPCFADLSAWQVKSVVDRHNEYREKHGSCPVTYNKEIAAWAKNSDGFKNTCNDNKSLQYNTPASINGVRYGENLAMVRRSIELQDWDPAEGVYNWYCGDEGCFDYDKPGFSDSTRHMTQVVWKDSLEIGCALCHVNGGEENNVYLICNYHTAGNSGEYGKNVQIPNTKPEGCANTEDECTEHTCGDGQTCNDPNHTKRRDYVCTCNKYNEVKAEGGPATCEMDECNGVPCGNDGKQTCEDPDHAWNKLDDFVCTCNNNEEVKQTGRPAVCEKDECDDNPCGDGQDCNDPDKSILNDYTCTCKDDDSIFKKGVPAMCTKDECSPTLASILGSSSAPPSDHLLS